ncbi:MAG TPA: hypothetical protein VMU11_03750 [Verrucomicrobiae bacterium]|nr:hypothetical protein [Verrucomicrobiae bacterium]
MKHKLFIAPLLILTLAGAGCGGAAPSGSDTTGSSPSGSSDNSMAGSGAAMAGGCSNPYYPFKPGSKITYQTSGGGLNSTYSMEVLDSGNADTHKLSYTFNVNGHSNSITQEFACDNGGIHAKGQLDLSSAMGGQFSYQTDSVDGPFLPSDMSVGQQWTTTYKVTLHTSNATMARIIEGKHQTTTVSSKVVGEEDVTVPAGTYHALKVQMDITINTEITPNPIHTTTVTWFVKNIGMVKSISTTNGSESTTEATEVSGF